MRFLNFIVEFWPLENGRPPVVAYQWAFGFNLALQAAALAWFAVASIPPRVTVYAASAPKCAADTAAATPPPIPYEAAIAVWVERVESARLQLRWWRRVGLASLGLTVTLCLAALPIINPTSVVHVVTVSVDQ